MNRDARHENASTANESASASAAPTTAYPSGIGRLVTPPMPCARIRKALRLDDELDDRGL